MPTNHLPLSRRNSAAAVLMRAPFSLRALGVAKVVARGWCYRGIFRGRQLIRCLFGKIVCPSAAWVWCAVGNYFVRRVGLKTSIVVLFENRSYTYLTCVLPSKVKSLISAVGPKPRKSKKLYAFRFVLCINLFNNKPSFYR